MLPVRSRQPVTFMIHGQFVKDFFYGKNRSKKIGSHDFGGDPEIEGSSENGFTLRGHFYYPDFFKGTVQMSNLTEWVYAWWVGGHCQWWDSTYPSALGGCTF